MTDLRSLTILGLIGRLLPQIDRGDDLPPSEVQDAIAKGTILEMLKQRNGDFPEFSPVYKPESILMQKELRDGMEAIDGRAGRASQDGAGTASRYDLGIARLALSGAGAGLSADRMAHARRAGRRVAPGGDVDRRRGREGGLDRLCRPVGAGAEDVD